MYFIAKPQRRQRLTVRRYLLRLAFRSASYLLVFVLVSITALFLYLTSAGSSPPPAALPHASGSPAQQLSDIALCGCRGADTCTTVEPIGQFSAPLVPRVIDPKLPASDFEAEKRRRVIRAAFMAAWDSYVALAWGHDELQPQSEAGSDSLGGMGATIVESLGTLYVLRLPSRYEAARSWVANNLDFDKVRGFVSVHEATTRVLGGLLSAYQLTGDPLYLTKAEDIGMRLSPAFDTLNGIPYPWCRLSDLPPRDNINQQRLAEAGVLPEEIDDDVRCLGKTTTQSEAGGISVEFRALAFHSLIPELRALRCKADRAVQAVVESGPSLLRDEITDELQRRRAEEDEDEDPEVVTRQSKDLDKDDQESQSLFESFRFTSMDSYYAYMVELWQDAVRAVGAGPTVDTTATFSTPARGFYEYLTKAWRQGGGCESALRFPLDASMHMLLRRAIYESPTGDLYLRTFEKRHNNSEAVVEQSMCYLPAVFSLAAKYKHISRRQEDQWQDVAEGITRSCISMYKQFPGKLGGDSARYNGKIWVTKGVYRLQADLVEALFYMWRGTGSEQYREEAWNTFLSIERECRVKNGAYTVLEEEVIGNITKGDLMPSEFLGSTLKLLYLIFSGDDVLSLNSWLFNRAGHALLVTPGIGAVNPCQTMLVR